MNALAEKLAKWFGSAPFIIFHIIWFGAWIVGNLLFQFDPEWSVLTIIVSLEAIFLSLFILRAENVASERQEREIKEDIKRTKQIIDRLDRRKNK